MYLSQKNSHLIQNVKIQRGSKKENHDQTQHVNTKKARNAINIRSHTGNNLRNSYMCIDCIASTKYSSWIPVYQGHK